MFRQILKICAGVLIGYGLLKTCLSGANTSFTAMSFFYGSGEQTEAAGPHLLFGLFKIADGLATITIYLGLFLWLRNNSKSWLKLSALGFTLQFLIDATLLLLPSGMVERPKISLYSDFAVELSRFLEVTPYGIFNAFTAIAIIFILHDSQSESGRI